MTLHEAWEALRSDPTNTEARLVLLEGLQQLSNGRAVVAAHREDAVSKATGNLLARIRDAELPELAPGQVDAYLRRTVVNASIDLHRKEQRQLAIVAKAAVMREEEVRRQAEREVPDAAWESLEEVFAKAKSMRDAWHRPGLQRAWDQVKRLHTENVTLCEILAAEEPECTKSEGDMNAAIERAYKAHTRLRGSLVAAAEALCRAGKDINPEAVRDLVGRLRRRRPSTPVRNPASPASMNKRNSQ